MKKSTFNVTLEVTNFLGQVATIWDSAVNSTTHENAKNKAYRIATQKDPSLFRHPTHRITATITAIAGDA